VSGARCIKSKRDQSGNAHWHVGAGAQERHIKAVVIIKDGRVIAERYAPGFDFGLQTQCNHLG
jgi:hypothetical protein